MKTIVSTCVISVAALLSGTAHANEQVMLTDACARVGTFANIALSQVKYREVALHSTYVYRKFAINTPLADSLVKGEHMMQAERKSPDVVAAELQNECEKTRTRVAAMPAITVAQWNN